VWGSQVLKDLRLGPPRPRVRLVRSRALVAAAGLWVEDLPRWAARAGRADFYEGDLRRVPPPPAPCGKEDDSFL
jgi:hypothetical protein